MPTLHETPGFILWHRRRIIKVDADAASRAPRLLAVISAIAMGLVMAKPIFAADECGIAVHAGTVNCVPGSYPAGIVYSVDDLTVNINGASAVGTSAAPVAGIGVSNIGAGAGTSTVATIGAVIIYTDGNYGYGLYAGAGNAVVSSSAVTYIEIRGAEGAKALYAHVMGSGNATATNNETVVTAGASGIDGDFGVYALATGGP